MLSGGIDAIVFIVEKRGFIPTIMDPELSKKKKRQFMITMVSDILKKLPLNLIIKFHYKRAEPQLSRI